MYNIIMAYKEEYKIKRRLNTKRWRENNPEKVKEYQKLYEQRDNTNKVRGLLCQSCNSGLGQFKESVLNLISAIKYLQNSTK